MSASSLHLNIQKKQGNLELSIAEDINLKGVTALYGPSASGKSTLLRLIAGLEKPDRGHIKYIEEGKPDDVWFDDTTSTKPKNIQERRIGYMFQDGRLFPHLNVHQNLRFASDRNKPTRDTLSIDAIIEALELESLLERTIDNLSGGEQKRVALGRTLLTNPKLLLLDEPLSGLDLSRKMDVLPFLERLPTQFGIPIIYVSHDLEEVVRLSDTMLVLSQGKTIAYNKTQTIIEALDPVQLGLRQQDDLSLLCGKIRKISNTFMLAHIDVGTHEFVLPLTFKAKENQLVTLLIKAKDVGISLTYPQESSIRNVVECIIKDIVQSRDSPFAQIVLNLNGNLLKSRITRAAAHELNLSIGQKVFALVKSASFESGLL